MPSYTKQFTDIYKKWVEESPREMQDWLRGEIRYLKEHIKPTSRVLEVGCGYGRILKALAPYQYEPWGLDNSPIQIRYAKKHCGSRKNVHFVLGDAREMPFKMIFSTIRLSWQTRSVILGEAK